MAVSRLFGEFASTQYQFLVDDVGLRILGRVLMQSPPNFQFSDIEAAGREKQQQNFECDLVVDNVAG